MGQEELGLLHVVLVAVLCFADPSLGAETVVTGKLGGSAELGCSLTSTLDGVMTPNQVPLHVVEWVRLGYNVPVLIKFGGYTPRVHPNYKGRVSVVGGASLLVNTLTLEDEGWFECRILLLDRTTDEFRNGTWTFLSISAPPVFVTPPPSVVEVLLGDSLTLSCAAFGNPKPSVIWRKQDDAVGKQIQVLSGTLSLSQVGRETAGMYKCHVSNSEGNLTHITHLQVKGPPVITTPPRDTVVNMSQHAVLQCRADAYPSNLTYEWRKDGQNVYHVEALKSRVRILVDGSLMVPDLDPEDSGNYTCIPTNGVLTPPMASAFLRVQHPARVLSMPPETLLPVDMGGKITCPVQADPPMLFVKWTKDGEPLDLQQYPGWKVSVEGSVVIAVVNENAVGVYTCTAYNSHGTMGQSEPTNVLLKDPPSFRVAPRAEYLQEVGRELLIPCQADAEPANITWSKSGSDAPPLYVVCSNGSLLLRPLTKEHQGAWECHATNRVATVTKRTMVLVLGTSPHAVRGVSVDVGVNHANVSWQPGFDGGYTQKFSVWVKPTARGKHEWASLPVPASTTHLLVPGLQPGTSYQFSILPQNKLGSGPFSEIRTMRTLVLDSTKDVPPSAKLPPPTSLTINNTAGGVLLQWTPPPVQSPPITAFVLQSRRENGAWVTLQASIDISVSEVMVPGLLSNSTYELRLLSKRGGALGEPSASVNISTEGMVVYPAPTSPLVFVSEPLMAGVIGGVCFLFGAVTLSLLTACVMKHTRGQRRRKRRDDLQSAFQKTRSPQASSSHNSPDSILKIKLCPPLNLLPTSSSSDRSDHSSFDRASRSEYQDQKRQLLSSSSPPPCYTLFESHLGGTPSLTSAIESISRGPDGRFITQSYPETSATQFVNRKPGSSGSPGHEINQGSLSDSKSSSVNSDRALKHPPTGQTDLLEISSCSLSKNVSHQRCFTVEEKQGSEAVLERLSFYSECQDQKAPGPLTEYKDQISLKHLAGVAVSNQLPQTRTESRTRREVDHVRINEKSNTTQQTQMRRAKSVSPVRNRTEPEREESVWKPQDIQLRNKTKRPSSLAQRVSDYRRGCYFGSTSSPLERLLTSSCHVQWDISPVTSPTTLVPLQSCSEGNTMRSLIPDESEQDMDIRKDSSSNRGTPVPCVSDLIHSSIETPTDRELQLNSRTLSDNYWRQNPEFSRASCSAPPEQDKVIETEQSLNHYTKTGTSLRCGLSRDRTSFSSLQPEQEKEGVRARSRKSEKCDFSLSPSCVSPLMLLNNDSEINQSDFSTAKLSESSVVKVPQPDRVPSLQSSAILEYLSLPGFVEMSVDEPNEEGQLAGSTPPGSNPRNRSLLRREPDVVPKQWNWDRNIQSAVPEPVRSTAAQALVNKRSRAQTSLPRSEQKPYHTQFGAVTPPISTTRNITKEVPSFSNQLQLVAESTNQSSQSNRTNKVMRRIPQAPVPCMKKSLSSGPDRTLSGMVQSHLCLQKSTSLGSQRWENYRSSKRYDSDYCKNVPLLDQRGLAPLTKCSNPNPGPLWQGTLPPERPHYSERPHRAFSLMHPHGPVSDPTKFRTCRRESEPRRQTAVFPEPWRQPMSYRDMLRSVQHRYVPRDPPRPFTAHRPMGRWDYHLLDSRTGPQKGFLPRGYSWPSPHQAAFPSADAHKDIYSKGTRDNTGGAHRASYASQSSGRGSVGPYGHGHLHPSLSITPTLMSSPETTEESHKHKGESDSITQKFKRRNVSVDESYEWDATEGLMGPDLLEAMKMERAGMWRGRTLRREWSHFTPDLQDLQEKGPHSSISLTSASQPPSSQYDPPLSEERFSALMQEFQEFRRAQKFCPHPAFRPPDPDSDSGSALL